MEETERNFEETETSEDSLIQKGIVLYELKDGSISMQTIGEENITLKELSYFKRYLDELESSEWEKRKKGGQEDVTVQE